MKIAIPTNIGGKAIALNGAQIFYTYEILDGEIVEAKQIGIGELCEDINTVAEILARLKADVVMCEKFNGVERVTLGAYGITIVGGFTQPAIEIANMYAQGKLSGCGGSDGCDGDCKSCGEHEDGCESCNHQH